MKKIMTSMLLVIMGLSIITTAYRKDEEEAPQTAR